MKENLKTIITSKDKSVEILRGTPTVVIGERINPTGRKAVLAALQAGDFEIVKSDALRQVEAGAKILDVNAGVPGADEPKHDRHRVSDLAAIEAMISAEDDRPFCHFHAASLPHSPLLNSSSVVTWRYCRSSLPRSDSPTIGVDST